MPKQTTTCPRRGFLKGAGLAALGVAGLAADAVAAQAAPRLLSVWSCGGLAEAMLPAHKEFEARSGVSIAYTGAFAAALGKSLLGSATTDVFAGRVLDLAKKLKAAGKMERFAPLCYTSYVLVTPKGNPAGVTEVADLAKPGVRVLLAPEASPPGGQAALGLLKKAKVYDQAMKNLVFPGSCVQRLMQDVVEAKGDVSVVELRLTRLPAFADRVEVLPIPFELYPPGPLTFTVGVMRQAKDPALAGEYAAYLQSPEGQAHFDRAGFIPAISPRGRELTELLGVKDA